MENAKRILLLASALAAGALFASAPEKPEGRLCGGWSEFRPLSPEDSALFAAAAAGRPEAALRPVAVAAQVVAGTNYLFLCAPAAPEGGAGSPDAASAPDGTPGAASAPSDTVRVKIFRPLPGRGSPAIVSGE